MVMDGAFSFYEFSQQNPDIDDSILSDVHSLDKQRFYNVACRLYGATNEQEIVTDR
jgi:Putative metallopeptidase